MIKEEIIKKYKSSFNKGYLYAEYLLFIFINDELVFSKNFSNHDDADATGWAMTKSSDWYGFDPISTLKYQVINYVTEEVKKEVNWHILKRK